jgi:hypothetical protein
MRILRGEARRLHLCFGKIGAQLRLHLKCCRNRHVLLTAARDLAYTGLIAALVNYRSGLDACSVSKNDLKWEWMRPAVSRRSITRIVVRSLVIRDGD